MVYTLDNVALDLPLAGVGSRVLAAFVDYLGVALLAMTWLILMMILATRFGRGSTAGLIVLAVAFFGLFVLEYGYFAGFEVFLGGETPGKKALGLVVVTREGARPSVGSLLARNLVRTVDLLVGIPLMIVDAASRRLGDRLAGTLVVYKNPLEAQASRTLARVPRGWGAREVALLESFLRREPELDPEAARTIAARLVSALRRDDPAFLEGLPDDEPRRLLRHATGWERQ
jgi:uncharacterized RDD family membrane protein YckC